MEVYGRIYGEIGEDIGRDTEDIRRMENCGGFRLGYLKLFVNCNTVFQFLPYSYF